MESIITKNAVQRRKDWIDKIAGLGGDFGASSADLQSQLSQEVKNDGLPALLDHLRLCSAIPESYERNSSQEKLYSKYTDTLISAAFSYFGLSSAVLTGRGNSADVEVVGKKYSFVADAKVFRLSRTARNQKDFKVRAMADWRGDKPYAMIVCPLYQVPSRTSQIYSQAASSNVCIFSYSHLAVLTGLVDSEGTAR